MHTYNVRMYVTDSLRECCGANIGKLRFLSGGNGSLSLSPWKGKKKTCIYCKVQPTEMIHTAHVLAFRTTACGATKTNLV